MRKKKRGPFLSFFLFCFSLTRSLSIDIYGVKASGSVSFVQTSECYIQQQCSVYIVGHPATECYAVCGTFRLSIFFLNKKSELKNIKSE